MQTGSVVVANANPVAAAKLAGLLNSYFSSVSIRGSAEDARNAISRSQAHAVVVDLETVGLDQVQQLCSELRDTVVVCTHRLADEEMWTAVLNAGATDCCYDQDIAGIIRAVAGPAMARSTAA